MFARMFSRIRAYMRETNRIRQEWFDELHHSDADPYQLWKLWATPADRLAARREYHAAHVAEIDRLLAS